MNLSTEMTEEQDLGVLADPGLLQGPVALRDFPRAELLGLLRDMKRIRRAEEAIAQLVTDGKAHTPCHLAIGQEACAVGVAHAVDRHRDRIFGAHRSHGHYLALGADLEGLLAEVLGKANGCSRGMGGSMHLIAPEVGLLGTVPIVGATVPIAVGAALAAQREGQGGIAVAFFGDGATEEGVVQESLNLAAVHRLPVVFACENNLFSSHLHIGLRQPAERVARFAHAHRIPSETLDGNDVVGVAEAAWRAAARGRAGGGPYFLELVTYRWRGHVGPREDVDVGVQRSGDLPLWKRRDPIGRLAEALLAAEMTTAVAIERMDAEIDAELRRALAAAHAAPYPDPDATTRFLYTDRMGAPA